MLFNSFEFLLFLPIVFILYWFVFTKLKWQNLFVVISSYVFYGWWDWRFLILIAFTTFCSYASGRIICSYDGRRKIQKMISGLNIVINLFILGVFKYYNFFVENLETLFSCLGIHLDWVTLQLILPVGISFYTFQALSYSIDVYQKKIKACNDIVAFYAYVSFFPQLVAGPIERATNLLPQFYKSRHFDYATAVDGCRQMLWGFFKKVVVADNCAIAVNAIWTDYQDYNGFSLFIGAILFTFQIYGDFSGYSDIAIGTAKLFGIKLMQNFKYPYLSRNIAEFWRRWHISLTTWFRDYIYFPLGGSRCSKVKVMRNTLIIFLVSGFWHGANWTFIFWGVYHALLFFPLLLWGKNKKYKDTVANGKCFPTVKEIFQMTITFLLVVVGWIIFRSESIYQAFSYIQHIFSNLGAMNYQFSRKTLAFIVFLLIVEWLQRNKLHALQINSNSNMFYKMCRIIFYYGLIFFILEFGAKQASFIYFQF